MTIISKKNPLQCYTISLNPLLQITPFLCALNIKYLLNFNRFSN